ncbi:hypothetical protein [Mesorhizobium sp. M1B.F.Ca.ET.045.04.1.1]|uniref:hypothetical protein n=1 Tax=Mesorhizobium sp. M1B.F.Ca.ET.045.04.1.1 TaxID=2493673 RepID=UPI000F7626AE|nr:hypothetical protein [Mesorhizobium sp. M1B.F.Ca.ET.045.04.1.1]AZO29377.1 hypothetical protein EJ071_19620 [Mesorhizobium sp. M1B.F.Ca.ET.045.04.1.1]
MNAHTYPALTATYAHDLVVTHVNGRTATLRRAGYVAPVVLLRNIIAKRADIRRIEIYAVRTNGTRNHVGTLHGKRAPLFNVSMRKVGGLTFIRLGRLCVSFCLTRKPV